MKKAVVSQSTAAVSERKAVSNRINAQRSTGPRTRAGKARSSLNALRHGILARAAFNVSLEGEDRRAEFDEIVSGLIDEFQPETMSERLMVQQAAGCYWRLAKVLTFETETAWRNQNSFGFPLDEVAPFFKYECFEAMDTMVKEQAKVFPKAGLVRPTIPNRACASTVMRHEASLNAVLFRCLNIMERRLKQRLESEEEPIDYMDESIETSAPEPATSASVESIQTDVTPKDALPPSSEKSAASAEKHERSQIGPIDATLSESASRDSQWNRRFERHS